VAANEIANNQADYIERQREKRRVLKFRLDKAEYDLALTQLRMDAVRCRCHCGSGGKGGREDSISLSDEGSGVVTLVESDEYFFPERTFGPPGLRRRRGRVSRDP
jgi:hypothetical protein